MDIATVTQLSEGFVKFVGETLAELKRAELASIDLDLLRLKRNVLTERLEDLEKKMAAAADLEKKNKTAELAGRGLANSTTLPSFTMAVQRDANEQLAVARREYNRAIEEIALMERRVNAGRPWWKRLWRRNADVT